MANNILSFLHYGSSLSPLSSFRVFPKKRVSVPSSSSSVSHSYMDQHHHDQIVGRRKLMEFPHLSIPHKDVMVDLVTAMETRVGSQLLPCSVPPDVEYYQNDTGTSQGTLHVRCGDDSSPIDFILASWLHLELPTGAAMDITNLQGYLKTSTDAPHFQFELCQCTPTYFILFIDWTPRKDLVLHPDYLKTFYEDTQLEQYRLKLDDKVVPEIKPFFSSSLYFRRVISPTGIMVSIACEAGGQERAGEIIRNNISPIAKEVLEMWVDKCVYGGKEVGEAERGVLKERDRLIKSRAIEMDLSSNMPKQFGQEVADRVLRFIRDVFKTNA